MKNFNKKRAAVLLTAIALLLAAAVGGTVAYLVASTSEVVNTFKPTEVKTEIKEDFNGKVKENVKIKNTGDIPVYIRAKVVFSYKDEKGGNVLSIHPEKDKDYTIMWGGMSWFNDGTEDGFWYYGPVVDSKSTTLPLIVECKPLENENIPDGYYLDVDILTQAIQATPSSVVEGIWPVTVGNKGVLTLKSN